MPQKGPFAESFFSRCLAAPRRLFMRFNSPDRHRAAMVLRQAAAALSGFPSSASRERLREAETRVHAVMQSALNGRTQLSRAGALRHAEEVFISSRRIVEAAAAVRRERGRLWPVVTEVVRASSDIVRGLESHLCSGRGEREVSRERLREKLELARRQLVSLRLRAHSGCPDSCRHELLALFQRADELIETLENRAGGNRGDADPRSPRRA